MNQVTRLPTNGKPTFGNWTGRQLDTMRRTAAPDANDDEFEMLVQYSVAKQLDPFVGHVILVIYNKTKPDKRRAVIITTQSGCRVLAARCGDYRPAESEGKFEYDEKLKGPTNPAGIVKCSVTLWKQDPKSDKWWPVNGTAHWEEFAPLKEIWTEGEDGKRKPTGKMELDRSGNWAKMPRLMVEKTATSMALRAGWPETFAGVYAEEEMDKSRVLDLSATELIEQEQEERRRKAIAQVDDEFPFVSDDGNLSFVPAGQFGDHVLNTAHGYKTKAELTGMQDRNREGFKRYWASHKNDALLIKREMEKIEAGLQ